MLRGSWRSFASLLSLPCVPWSHLPSSPSCLFRFATFCCLRMFCCYGRAPINWVFFLFFATGSFPARCVSRSGKNVTPSAAAARPPRTSAGVFPSPPLIRVPPGLPPPPFGFSPGTTTASKLTSVFPPDPLPVSSLPYASRSPTFLFFFGTKEGLLSLFLQPYRAFSESPCFPLFTPSLTPLFCERWSQWFLPPGFFRRRSRSHSGFFDSSFFLFCTPTPLNPLCSATSSQSLVSFQNRQW